MKIIPYDNTYRDDMIFMVIQEKTRWDGVRI